MIDLIPLTREKLKAFDSWLEEWRRPADRVITCHCGCSACCDLSVGITAAEALLIAPHIPKSEAERWRILARRITAFSEEVLVESEFFAGYRKRIGPCGFLGPEGECRVYKDRPLSCRMLITDGEKEFCSADFSMATNQEAHDRYLRCSDNPDHAGPWFLKPVRVARAFETALHQATIRVWGISYSGIMPLMVSLALDGFFERHGKAPHILVENGISPLLFQRIYSI